MKVSVLNLVPLRDGQNYRQAMESMVRLAQRVESYGYERYWIAEHHNAPTLASSSTQLLIEHTLANTNTIRVGAGGVMLPNHSPYIVAEQYGTLETLYPGRVDLGLGRAPGTDQKTARALRRNVMGREFDFPEEVDELRGYFAGTSTVKAYPADGLNVPIYILGSSTDSAHLAARLGLPYSFASHFAPAMMEEAVAIYRREFRPSSVLNEPYVILGANVVAADTDKEAERLLTTQVAMFLGIVTGSRSPMGPPVASLDELWNQHALAREVPHFGPVRFDPHTLIGRERQVVAQMSEVTLSGSAATVRQQLDELRARVDIDEVIAVSYIYDEDAQARSYEIFAEVAHDLP
ncbi:LLM class flavin-dependent oxidoreductase [Arcanobacterium haemolyticum]|nr:LLM class flavin-dependent oxidoreductase [Arcanobacterium haemolyticum]